MSRHIFVLPVILSGLLAANSIFAVEVPSTPPKALKETQDPAAVAAHEKVAREKEGKEESPVIPPDWIDQIRKMVTENSHRESKPVEKLDVIFKSDGALAKLSLVAPRNEKRTPNSAEQNHEICSAVYDAKAGKFKLEPKGTVEGPDLYERFSIEQLPTVCQELTALRRLQKAFIKVGLHYTLEATVIVAPDGKSWAWEVGPSEEQMPNVIYGIYYYPVTGELHSVRLDNKKAAAKLEKAAQEAGMQLKWFKDMRDR